MQQQRADSTDGSKVIQWEGVWKDVSTSLPSDAISSEYFSINNVWVSLVQIFVCILFGRIIR
jgi:hypothetical protein